MVLLRASKNRAGGWVFIALNSNAESCTTISTPTPPASCVLDHFCSLCISIHQRVPVWHEVQLSRIFTNWRRTPGWQSEKSDLNKCSLDWRTCVGLKRNERGKKNVSCSHLSLIFLGGDHMNWFDMICTEWWNRVDCKLTWALPKHFQHHTNDKGKVDGTQQMFWELWNIKSSCSLSTSEPYFYEPPF